MNRARLSNCFHPVAPAGEVTGEPRSFELLGEQLVLFRDEEGSPVAFKDLCVHRGARLSLGEVTAEGHLRCPYHGWEYASTGACVRIPSLPEGSPIPARARAFLCSAEERYGVVWVCLDKPHAAVPRFPNDEWDDPAWRGFVITTQLWQSSAGRILENFCDWSHLPWVHEQMASRDHPVVAPYDVWKRGDQVGYTIEHRTEDGPVLPFTDGRVKDEFVVTLPYTVHLRQVVGRNGETSIISMSVAPLGPTTSRVFLWSTRNHHLDPAQDEALRAFAIEVTAQDRRIVESQRPEMIPLELREEMHLKVPDAFSIVYRRLVEEFGYER